MLEIQHYFFDNFLFGEVLLVFTVLNHISGESKLAVPMYVEETKKMK